MLPGNMSTCTWAELNPADELTSEEEKVGPSDQAESSLPAAVMAFGQEQLTDLSLVKPRATADSPAAP